METKSVKDLFIFTKEIVAIKFFALLVLIYIGAGIALFPGWYYRCYSTDYVTVLSNAMGCGENAAF